MAARRVGWTCSTTSTWRRRRADLTRKSARVLPWRAVVYHCLVMADSKPAAYEAAAAAPFPVAVDRVKPHTKLIGLLALGHFVIDVNQGSLPAVLPFEIGRASRRERV